MIFSADFETTTAEPFTKVWLWGVFSLKEKSFEYGTDINSFFEFCKIEKNSTFYFHNLKFDGQFLIWHLLKNGFIHKKDKKEIENNTFTTLIDDAGSFYEINVYFEKTKKKTIKATFRDSLKILPFSVAEVAGAFNLSIKKGKINYDRHNIECPITQDEIAYLRNDVEIVAQALGILFEQGLDRMTTASNAMKDFKEMTGKETFEKLFPLLSVEQDEFIRKSYKGGFTYLNPIYKNRNIGSGIVFDVNSLYPSVMFYEPMPFGEPLKFEGKYKENKYYPLYVQKIICHFELKKGMLPTIQLKNNPRFVGTEYLISNNGEDVILTLTSVDLKLFLEHYNVTNIEYLGGYMFKQTTAIFKGYIKKWIKVKNEATINKNGAMRTLAKLMLNSLYGKFALNPKCSNKLPFLDNDIVRYSKGEEETRKSLYIPIGAFITAYARDKTIRSAQKVKERFIYADTDSLHLEGTEIPQGLKVSPINLGEWKLENKFLKARFLRAKRYIEYHITMVDFKRVKEKEYHKKYKIGKIANKKYKNVHVNITCAGMPKTCYALVTWENYKDGAIYGGKLVPKNIAGGCILVETEFSLKA